MSKWRSRVGPRQGLASKPPRPRVRHSADLHTFDEPAARGLLAQGHSATLELVWAEAGLKVAELHVGESQTALKRQATIEDSLAVGIGGDVHPDWHLAREARPRALFGGALPLSASAAR